MKYFMPLFLYVLGVSTAAALAGSFGAHAQGGVVGRKDFLVTLKSGQSYSIPVPATKYPGSPFNITVLDPGMKPNPSIAGSWIAKATISIYQGSVSFMSVSSQSGGFNVRTIPPGQATVITEIDGVGTPVQLQSTSSGSNVSLSLVAPVGSGYPVQTFIVRVQGDD
jgi:hypothetical protein